MPGWIQRVGPDGKSVFVPKGQAEPTPRLQIVPDIPDYTSPIDGRPVSGRKQRREDLKRNGCVEYDPAMKAEARKRKEAAHEALAAKMIDRMKWHNA